MTSKHPLSADSAGRPDPRAVNGSQTAAAPAEVLFELRDVGIGSELESLACLVEGVNWQVVRGQFWVIGGPAESGKSALLSTAAGLRSPCSGRQVIRGKTLDELSDAQRLAELMMIGLVHDLDARLLHNLTLADNVALPLCYHRNWSRSEAEPRVRALLEKMELIGYDRRLPEQVSRNQRQRAILARALAIEPEVLLLDNPLAGLNPPQARWWLDQLEQLHQGHSSLGLRPITMVVATDDYRPWLSFDAQFALLKGRQWIVLGTREDLLSSEEPLVRDLLTSAGGPKSP
jgi:ABC-type transporter Mla maintaining outer membrane lipid asymmetry ATPase subunit MlaF